MKKISDNNSVTHKRKDNNMEPRFSILTLGVNDLEKSFKFYNEGLGFPSKGIVGKEFENGEAAFFDLENGFKMAIYSRKNLAWDSQIAESSPSPTEFSIGYLTKNKDEVDKIMKLAEKAGGVITKPAQKAFWGGYSGYFQDPDGHLWEILWSAIDS